MDALDSLIEEGIMKKHLQPLTIPNVVLVLYIALGIAIWMIDRIPYLAERSWTMALSNDKPELLVLTAAHL